MLFVFLSSNEFQTIISCIHFFLLTEISNNDSFLRTLKLKSSLIETYQKYVNVSSKLICIEKDRRDTFLFDKFQSGKGRTLTSRQLKGFPGKFDLEKRNFLFVFDVELQQAFDLFDSDGSGGISPSELRRALEALNIRVNDAELRQMFSAIDTDSKVLFKFVSLNEHFPFLFQKAVR